MKHVELAVVGAGPAGLSASIEAAKQGVRTLVFDENSRPGGQLFKQIHKFFGSSDQMAGMRGFEIGNTLLNLAESHHVEIQLNTKVIGIDSAKKVAFVRDGHYDEIAADKIILSCGATEKPLDFPGWTLPGVMGAGAAQTLVNIQRVLPGKDIVMVGSGNVGLMVAYHLLQAGVRVKAIVEASQKITGYGVHAAKLRRSGIPFLLGHTINKVLGTHQVQQVELIQLDRSFNKMMGTECSLDADTVCLAVGLSPSTELARMMGCELYYNARLGGYVPKVNAHMETSVPGIYSAGDMTGVEEASIAMEEGRLAGLCCASALGYCQSTGLLNQKIGDLRRRLTYLRNEGGRQHA